MKKSNFKVLVMPAIILFVICLVSTFLLALTNKITVPEIAELAISSAEAARLELLPEAISFEKSIANLGGVSYEYYTGVGKDGKTAGYVFTTVSTGYSGDIKVMTGVDMNGAVKKVSILELSETPGLGMNAKKDSFINQYIGQSGAISVVKTKAGKNQIQAMTGATITSGAVTGAVNKALEIYMSLSGQATTTTVPESKAKSGTVNLYGKDYTYEMLIDGNSITTGYIFITEATGYSGNIIKLKINIDLKGTIKGIEGLIIEDTSGYGSGFNTSYLNQFIGKNSKISGKGDGVQAISGATITSNAITAAVNTAFDLYNSVAGGNQ